MARNTVDLPEPLGPMMAVIRPSGRVIVKLAATMNF